MTFILFIANCRNGKQVRGREGGVCVRWGSRGVGQVWERHKGVCSNEPLFYVVCHWSLRQRIEKLG